MRQPLTGSQKPAISAGVEDRKRVKARIVLNGGTLLDLLIRHGIKRSRSLPVRGAARTIGKGRPINQVPCSIYDSTPPAECVSLRRSPKVSRTARLPLKRRLDG